MSEVLLVSKAVEPPWNDSSKNLVRDLASSMTRHVPVVMTSRHGLKQSLGRARLEPLYPPGRARFAPQVRAQLPVLRRLVLDRRADIFHFFFAPNARTSTVAGLCSRARARATVQTVCSAPAADADIKRILFADRTIVLSQHTLVRFAAAGVPEDRLVLIPPCIPALEGDALTTPRQTRARHGLPESAPLLVYPGDLEFSRGADRCVSLMHQLRGQDDAVLAVCAREKTPAAAARRAELRARAAELGLERRVRFLGEVSDIHCLLLAADLVLLPSETLYAKMDLPLVLLEAMALMRPVIVLKDTAAEELCADGAAVAVSSADGELAERVQALLSDGAERSALGQRARARVLSHHSPQAMAQAYEALYDQLC